jgi:hypothetical protein
VLQRRARRRRRWRLPSRRWRSALVKVAAAIAIASLAVAYQESLPRTVAKDAGGAAGRNGDLAALRIVGHQGSVVAAAGSDRGRWVVSAGSDGTLRIWNAASGALARTVELPLGAATALAVDDQRALTGHGSGAIVLWDLERAEPLATFQHGTGTIAALAFADEDTFAAAAQDGTLALFDIRAPAVPAVPFDGRGGPAMAAARGQGLIATALEHTVRLWRTPETTLARSYRSSGGDITALALSPDGRSVAAAAADGSIRIWRSSERPVHLLRSGKDRRISALAFGPNGTLAAAGEDGRVELWRLGTGRIARSLDGGPLRALSFSPEGGRLIGAGRDGVIRVWALAGSGTGSGKPGL